MTRSIGLRLSLCLCLALLGCSDGPATYGDQLADPEVPPRGHADLMTWLEAGHYLAWRCEDAPHPARPGSGHGSNRICSNAALASASGTGLFPVGAASVKEIFASDGSIRLYAVALKVAAEPGGDSWYWFEGSRGDVIANGEGDGTCTGCHSRAPQDYLYTVIR
jgi:hypothetical protein